MPKGRHVGKSKAGKDKAVVVEKEVAKVTPSFTCLEKISPLLTLLFESKEVQHAALSRIEAFYEDQKEGRRYLTLEEAKQERLCQHYEAYNFPLAVVKQWLQCMRDRHAPLVKVDRGDEIDNLDTPWWKHCCNDHEIHLLDHLASLGVVQTENVDDKQDSVMTESPPIYLISTLSSKQSALHHERLHFLYYVSAEYRQKVAIQYRSLSTKARKIIENDLSMRKYSPSVWEDEFQAYVSEDAAEFGRSIYEECEAIQSILKPLQRQLWRDLKL